MPTRTARSEDARNRAVETARIALLLTPVNDRPISALIVEQVRALIHEGKLAPGDRLPPERELCERFRVSRVSVREALRVLEAGGLVDTRVGAGALIKKPSSERLEGSLVDLFAVSSLRGGDVGEVRLLLEVGIFPLLCTQADDKDISDLQDICDRQAACLAGGGSGVALAAEFHSRLGASTRNTALEILLHSFSGLRSGPPAYAQPAVCEAGHRGLREHRAVLACVQSRDPAAGARVMRGHLTRSVSSRHPQADGSSFPHGPKPGGAAATAHDGKAVGTSLVDSKGV